MDPGIDDALALMLALRSPEVQIIGISTVAGNAPVELTSANARRVLEYLNAEIPVARGVEHPLKHPLAGALDYHGPDGLGQCGLPSPSLPLYPAPAWDFLSQKILAAPGEITLVATGPLTNLALAFEHYPEICRKLAGIVLMGGAYGLTPYGKGNQTPFAEFNIWQDPEAAYKVFTSGVDIIAVGLDVTMDPKTRLEREHLEQLKVGHTHTARLAARLSEYAIERYGHCELHDPLALAALLDPSLFNLIPASVEVVRGDGPERGSTRLFPNKTSRIKVASAVDGPRFLNLFLSRMLKE